MGNPQLVAFSAAGGETIGAAAPPQWLLQFARMIMQEQSDLCLMVEEDPDSCHKSPGMGYAVAERSHFVSTNFTSLLIYH